MCQTLPGEELEREGGKLTFLAKFMLWVGALVVFKENTTSASQATRRSWRAPKKRRATSGSVSFIGRFKTKHKEEHQQRTTAVTAKVSPMIPTKVFADETSWAHCGSNSFEFVSRGTENGVDLFKEVLARCSEHRGHQRPHRSRRYSTAQAPVPAHGGPAFVWTQGARLLSPWNKRETNEKGRLRG